MEKKEYFEKFRENSDFFSYPVETMDFLEGLNACELTNKNIVRYISPLLNEMFDYSLIYPNLDVYYIQGLSDDNRTELYDRAQDVARAANYYIADLFDNGSNHPSVLRYYYMDDGIAHFEIMKSLLEEMRVFIPDVELYDYDRLYNSLDKGVMFNSGRLFLEASSNIKKVDNPNLFMHYIARNALDLAVRRLLLFGENDAITFGIDEEEKNGSIFRNVNDDKTLCLMELFNKINELRGFDEENLDKYIDDVYDEYIKYKTHQYNYLRYSYLEGKLLKKSRNF